MKILLTNDDGVHAPGINVLYECLKDIGDVYMVAPLTERSTTGHTVTLDHPLRVAKISDRIFGCSGYPADCVLMAIGGMLDEVSKFDLVVSGINRGANLGQDMYYSGTVAAAREAAFHGIKSIAVSSVYDFNSPKEDINYWSAGRFICELIKSGMTSQIKPMSLLNVNVPDLDQEKIKGVKLTTMGFRKYSEDVDRRTDCRKRPYYWIAGTYGGFSELSGSDCEAVDQGFISVSPIQLMNTNTDMDNEWSSRLQELKFE